MQIGEAARRTGLDPTVIRFYEDSGVLPRARRTESGYRDYGMEDLELLRFVKRLRSLELPLEDVQQIVDLWTNGKPPCGVVRSAITREAAAIEQRIRELQRLQVELADLERAAESIEDEWPGPCVCHAVEPSLRE